MEFTIEIPEGLRDDVIKEICDQITAQLTSTFSRTDTLSDNEIIVHNDGPR
jgi:hypothetical protein